MTAWYLLRGENKYGPFSYLDVVKMLQEKKAFEFDFIWHSEMDAWKRISEVADFQPDKIRNLKDSPEAKSADVFFRRRHARANYGASILVHNNKDVWTGNSIEVSPGGAGVVLETDTLTVGMSLHLHFKAGDGVPPFNASCTVTSKAKVDGGFRYGFKFTSVSQSIQIAIKKYTDKKAS